MTIPSFAPVTGTVLALGTTSINATIPTGGTIALATNLGSGIAFLAIGTSAALAATNSGLPVLPGDSVAITIGSATTIAGLTLAGATGLNLTVGN